MNVDLDVEAPKITCPSDLEVTVAHWSDNSTIVHYDAQQPQMSDNSGHAGYRVIGVPNQQRRFGVGVVALTYEAFDEAGNVASCVQHIRVRGLSVCSIQSKLYFVQSNRLLKTFLFGC